MAHSAPYLLGNFFAVVASVHTPGQLQAQLRLNPHHPAFRGHFPGRPVVPGVCVLAMVKDVLAQHLGKALLLRDCGQVKFLHLINPLAMPVLDLAVSYWVEPYFLDFQICLQHQQQVLSKATGRFQTDFL